MCMQYPWFHCHVVVIVILASLQNIIQIRPERSFKDNKQVAAEGPKHQAPRTFSFGRFSVGLKSWVTPSITNSHEKSLSAIPFGSWATNKTMFQLFSKFVCYLEVKGLQVKGFTSHRCEIARKKIGSTVIYLTLFFCTGLQAINLI